MTSPKKTIAVVFGGRSVEHDVSILTGLQFLDALDPARYDGLAVYIDPLGAWWTGPGLRRRSRYPLTDKGRADLTPLTLAVGQPLGGRPAFQTMKKGVLGSKSERIEFDLIVPALHGTNGEDGTLQGLLDLLEIPYAGARTLASAATMDKVMAKRIVAADGVPVLPHLALVRPEGAPYSMQALKEKLATAMPERDFPFIVKPAALGSSIAVGKADDGDALLAAVLAVFRVDTVALIEPAVAPLKEYNVAVRRDGAAVILSAIERPLGEGGDILDFDSKYRAGGGGPKLDDAPSEGMASLNRVIEPDDLTPDRRRAVVDAADKAARALGLNGSARIDFLCNDETGALYFNEVNPIPGSFAYYLWQAAPDPLNFTDLATALIEEGFALADARRRDTASSAGGASIFG